MEIFINKKRFVRIKDNSFLLWIFINNAIIFNNMFWKF